MVCPKCGAEIPEGLLICEKCGTDIQIVPDYDPNEEIHFTGSLEQVQKQLQEENGKGFEEEEDVDEDNPFADDEITTRTRIKVAIILLVAVIVVGAMCGVMFAMMQNNSLDHFVSKSKLAAEAGDYETALDYLYKAELKYADDAEVRFMISDNELKAGNQTAAIDALARVIESNQFKDSEKFLAYDKLIKIYKDNEDFQAINALLIECKYDSIVSGYQNYLANKPEFSVEEGTYDEIISLRLNSNTSGKIYYTMNGSKPTTNSDVYSGPITLESGKYVISAMFINIYGIESEVAVKEYNITLVRPEGAVVSLDSGEYYEPSVISVTCERGSRIFYTTDDSIPTMDSVPYTGAIPMPLGVTNFKFVTMNNAGIYSEPVERTYDLILKNSISTDTAVSLLIDELIAKGYLLDREGHRASTNGKYSYKFSSVIRTADGKDYYTINEYFDDGTGMPIRTDVVYIAGVYDGSVARQGFNEVGRYIAVPF